MAHRQLRKLPMGKRRIARWVDAGQLYEQFPSVYSVGTEVVTKLGRLMAAVLACGPDSFISHRTAAWLWALGITTREIEVTVARSNSPDVDGIKTRKSTFAPGETTRRHGIPVTSLYRTLIDLAAVLDEDALVYALDQAGRHNLSIPRLRAEMERHCGRKGIGKLRKVLDEYHPTKPVNSKLEWLALIQTADGFREGDLVFADAKVILEIQSKEHHGSWQARIRDNRRAAELQADGWQVVQATLDDLRPGEASRTLGQRLAKIITARTASRCSAARPPTSGTG